MKHGDLDANGTSTDCSFDVGPIPWVQHKVPAAKRE